MDRETRETLKEKRDEILAIADSIYGNMLADACKRAEDNVATVFDLLKAPGRNTFLFTGVKAPFRVPLAYSVSAICRGAYVKTYLDRMQMLLGQRFQFEVDSSDAQRGRDEEGMFEEYHLIVSISPPQS